MTILHLKFNTIFLLCAVPLGFILTTIALFLPQWIRDDETMFAREGTGLVPFPPPQAPTYFRVSSVLMIISFVLYALSVGFLVLAVVSFMLKKLLLAQIGYLLLAIPGFPIYVLQFTSWIITLLCHNGDGYFSNPAFGVCPYLALISGFCALLSAGVAAYLFRSIRIERRWKP